VRDYVPLGEMEVGTILHVQGGGEAILVSKTWRQGDFEVFDFEVEGLHNFYVRGEGSDKAGVLVHNSTGKQLDLPLGRSTANDLASPSEAYDRAKHYGKSPTAGDRTALGAGPDEVVDHQPPLVQRYYEGDPSIGEKPGWQMTPAERKASAGDRSRMQLQPKADSHKQGGEMSQYSKEQKQKHGL